MAYGATLARDTYTPNRSVIGDVEASPSGNIILRVGREIGAERDAKAGTDGAWEQTEHVVLAPDEAVRLATAMLSEVVGAWAPDATERPQQVA